MGDLLAAVRDLNEKMRALLNAGDGGAFTAATKAKGVTEADDADDVAYHEGFENSSLRVQRLPRLRDIGHGQAWTDRDSSVELVLA